MGNIRDDEKYWTLQEINLIETPLEQYQNAKRNENTKVDPFKKQIGGDHYKNFAIQPAQYNRKNNLGWYEANVVKYVSRHRFKNKRQDIEKAIHMLECILKEYDDGDLT